MPSSIVAPTSAIIDPAKMARALTNQLNQTARSIKVDFGVTTATWEHTPTFRVESPSTWEREITTDDATYAMLNDGTRAHLIPPGPRGVLVFRTPFRAKSRPRYIGSNKGAKGKSVVFTRRPIRHPGTAARNWDAAIAEKWQAKFPAQMQRAIDAGI